MTKKEMFLLLGVVIGGILWGSITSLIENNGLLSIMGLAFSSLVMGIAMGMNIGSKDD